MQPSKFYFDHAVQVMGGRLEAGFREPLRNRTAHVAISDKSELVFFRRDWIHTELSFRRGLNEFFTAFSRPLVSVIYKLNIIGSFTLS